CGPTTGDCEARAACARIPARDVHSRAAGGASMTQGPQDAPIRLSGWALILGASSGFGEATALALAGAGMSIVGVHLDRKATLPNAERIAAEVKRRGGQALFFNVNAADAA